MNQKNNKRTLKERIGYSQFFSLIMPIIEGYSAVQSVLATAVLRALFCPCGGDFPSVGGFCLACYRAAAHSRQRFAGFREEILDRDGRLCRACGSADRLHVHHRKPGVNDPDWLITVCAGCHARLHRLAALRVCIPELLVVLWIEQHPGAPV
jgi:hypothetical protein